MTDVAAFECGPVATMCYLVCDDPTGTAYVVDAPAGCTDPVVREAATRGCRITDIVLTHTHWDHTADCAELQRRTNATVTVHAADLYRLTDPMAHTIWPLHFTIEPVTNVTTLSGSDGEITLNGRSLRWVHTPGHTEGGICIVDDAGGRVFVGDTLFEGSVGRVDLPGGDGPTLVRSIRTRLFVLPDSTVVLPGHGPTTTIGDERRTNPFVREDER